MAAESFNHLEIPADLLEEAEALQNEVDAVEADELKVKMIDKIQTIATQVGLLQKAAKHLNKDVRDVTALDVATYRLHEHEEFVSTVQLDKVVLFSHEKALENFREGQKAIASRYDGGKLPEDVAVLLGKVEKALEEKVANQEIIEVPVSEDLYQEVQENMFPSFQKKGITAQEVLDYVGGSDGLIDPVTFQVRDLLIQLEKAPASAKSGLLKQLETSIVAYEQGLSNEFSEEEKAVFGDLARSQEAADASILHKLGRRPVLGDFNPERRLERSLDICHPILAEKQIYYVHGDVTNVKEATKAMMRDEAPTIEFTARADFNPPTGYLDITPEQLRVEPQVHRTLQASALDFPMWEGEDAARAINSAELIIEMKLFRLFNYAYPMLGDTKEGQDLFMEMYDVSPGEPTLEWALAYPTKEHTFYPEHPIVVQVFEDDEEIAPIIWPEYTPVSVVGVAEVSSSKGGDHATIRFLPHSKEQSSFDAHYNHVFSSLPVEKRFSVSQEQIEADIKKLSPSDKAKAEAAWDALSGSQRQLARQAWTFEATPTFSGAQLGEAVAKLNKAALSDKL